MTKRIEDHGTAGTRACAGMSRLAQELNCVCIGVFGSMARSFATDTACQSYIRRCCTESPWFEQRQMGAYCVFEDGGRYQAGHH